jgi:Flp pilus assembly protein CpaB
MGLGIIILVVLVTLFLSMRGGGSKNTETASAPIETRSVVFSTQAIPSGTTFKYGEPLATYFTVKQVDPALVPLGAYSSVQQIENVIKGNGCQPQTTPGCAGQISTTQTIYQNIPVVSGMFTTLGPYRSAAGPAFTIPYGYVAISLDLNNANAVAGSIQPGDTIDLMASYTGTASRTMVSAPPQTQYIMSNVKVIGIGTLPGPSAQPSSGSSTPSATTQAQGGTAAGSIVILARYQQALVLQHLKDFGWQLSAVLRSAHDAASIPHFKTMPVTDRWFFVKSSNPFQSNPGY